MSIYYITYIIVIYSIRIVIIKECKSIWLTILTYLLIFIYYVVMGTGLAQVGYVLHVVGVVVYVVYVVYVV